MIEQVVVRRLRAGDLGVLDGVLTRAYGQSFARRLASYLQMTALGTFVAVLEGTPVGMVIGNDYGSLAYVAQMAVDPPFQRRGIATVLMNAAIAWADERGFDAVELDATPAGAPLYARYGFVASGRTDVYELEATGARPSGALPYGAVRPYTAADRTAVLALDARAFGGDRSEVIGLLLDDIAGSVVVAAAAGRADDIVGYAVAQPEARRLGPVVAVDAANASALITAASGHLRASHTVSVPADHPGVAKFMADHGYRFVRSLDHLIRGTLPPASRTRLFARINLGQG